MPSDTTTRHRFYGRRKGKPLTALRQKIFDDVFPKYKIDPNQFFHGWNDGENGRGELWLEIGFGNGEYLSHMSRSRPDICFIGCEPFVNGITALLASLDTPVQNLKIWDDNARILMDGLPDHCLDRVYLLNPDPWPKTRHHKRRFVQKDSMNILSRLLKPKGLFVMSTDVAELAEWMHLHAWAHPDFEWMARSKDDWVTPPIDWPIGQTRYMKKALGGKDIYWLIFKRR